MLKLKNLHGFTLIELSIVMLVVGLMLVGLLGPLSTQIEQEERQTALTDLQQIEEALYGFTIVNGRLPCPDCNSAIGGCAAVAANNINDGNEDRTGVPLDCASSSGNIPWVELSVPQFDPWQVSYQYAVDSRFADDNDGTQEAAPCNTSTVGVSFELCSTANITIQDKGAGCLPVAPGGNSVATLIPAVIFSQGKKQVAEFPVSCYEQENTDGNATFVTTGYSRHTGADATDPTLNYYFDDILIWISPHILKNKMVSSERLP